MQFVTWKTQKMGNQLDLMSGFYEKDNKSDDLADKILAIVSNIHYLQKKLFH